MVFSQLLARSYFMGFSGVLARSPCLVYSLINGSLILHGVLAEAGSLLHLGLLIVTGTLLELGLLLLIGSLRLCGFLLSIGSLYGNGLL